MSEYPADRVPGTDPNSASTSGGTVVASLTPLAQQYLDQTRPWVRLMSVFTFVSAGLMVVMGLAMLLLGIFGGFAAGNRQGPGVFGSAVGGALVALFYVAMACVYIAPGIYLSRYATAIKRLKVNSTAAGLEDALKHQKSFWRFIGIMTVISLALAVVAVGVGHRGRSDRCHDGREVMNRADRRRPVPAADGLGSQADPAGREAKRPVPC